MTEKWANKKEDVPMAYLGQIMLESLIWTKNFL